MRIIARRTLRDFIASRAGSADQQALRSSVDSWYDEVRKATWSSTADIKSQYASASVITADRVVFNIKGNSYRLVVSVAFERETVFIKWIGSHADYDKIDVKTVQYGE